MRIAMTGTQKGMNAFQMSECWILLHLFRPKEVHHGGCVGADKNFHDIVRHLPGPSLKVHCHPAWDKVGDQMADCYGDKNYQSLPPLVRNQEMVMQGVDGLWAFPHQERMIVRSGTWATVRYALKADRRVFVITPTKFLIWQSGRDDVDVTALR